MRHIKYLFILFCFFLFAAQAEGRVVYGYNISEQTLTAMAKARFKKDMVTQNPLCKPMPVIRAIEKPHTFHDQTLDFSVLLVLIGIVAVFKFSNAGYFRNLFRAFRNQTLSTRQLRDQLQQNSAAGLLLDFVFCCSMGLYLYYVIVHLHLDTFIQQYSAPIILLAVILLFGAIYLVRFLFLKFTGWVFNISEITNNYTFNVFLINRIMGILIIPFTIVLAFGQGAWVQVALLLSFIMIAILFLNRYLRSGVVFGYFIKFSKFHFFMYLCASELLPLAILVKVIKACFFS